MSPHLSSDELVDAVEGHLSPGRDEHLSGCASCRMQLAALAGVLSEVSAVDMPEPSPLFWTQLSDNIRRAIAADSVPSPARRWFQWPVLAPIAGLALLVLALVTAVVPMGEPVRSTAAVAPVPAMPSDSSADSDEAWELMAALIGNTAFDPADDAVDFATPGSADAVVGHLTADEQHELARLVREELEQSYRPLVPGALKGSGG